MTTMRLHDGHWASITNWQDLQRLANDIIFYEAQGQGIQPSNPRLGADGGWDGRFTGKLAGLSGIHMVQSKHHGGKPEEVTKAIASEMPKAIANAIKRDANHLIVATNGELKIEQVRKLEASDKGTLQSITVWYRSRLAQYIERHPGLLNLHFNGIGAVNNLIVPVSYFTTYEGHLDLADIVPDSIDPLLHYLAGEDDRFLLIHGHGGIGKSHFLRHLAEQLIRQPQTIVRVVTQSPFPLAQVLRDELRPMAEERIVLILDDAERHSTQLLTDLAQIVTSETRYRAVVSCRTAALEPCRSAMSLRGRRPPPKIHEVPVLTDSDLTALIHRQAPTKCPADRFIRAAIHQFDGNPYLLRLWADAHEQGGYSPDKAQQVYDIMIQRLEASCREVLDGCVHPGKLRRFLAAVAGATPSNFDQSIVAAISSITEIPPGDITIALGRLENGRILRRIGDTLRFSPDMTGDVIFASELTDPTFRTQVVVALLPLNPAGLAASLASAQQLGKSTEAGSVADGIIRSWASEKDNTPWESVERFRLVAQLTLVSPDEALYLISNHLSHFAHCQDAKPRQEAMHLPAAWHNAATILRLLCQIVRLRPSILSLMVTYVPLLKQGERKDVSDIIIALFRPIHVDIAAITHDLNWLADHLAMRETNEAIAWIAPLACEEVLAASHEDQYSDNLRIFFVPYHQLDVPLVRAMRQSAIGVILSLFRSGNVSEALTAADKIGSSATTFPSKDPESLPLAGVFETERIQILSAISSMDFASWSFANLYHLDSICMKWWSHHQAEIIAADILTRMPRTAAYRLFLRQTSHIIVEDFPALAALAPEQRRWNWLIEHHSNGWSEAKPVDDQKYQHLAEELAASHSSAESVMETMLRISQAMNVVRCGHRGDTSLDRWVQITPALFMNARLRPAWQQVNATLNAQVLASLLRIDHGMIRDLSLRMFSSTEFRQRAIDDILVAISCLRPSIDSVRAELIWISEQAQIEFRLGLLDLLWRHYSAEFAEVQCDLICRCLTTGYDKALLQPLGFILKGRVSSETVSMPDEILHLILSSLTIESAIDHEVQYPLEEITSQSFPIFLDLINRRIQRYEQLRVAGQDEHQYYKIFPGTTLGWAKCAEWSAEQCEAYVDLIMTNSVVFSDKWESRSALDPITVHNAFPDGVAECLVRHLGSSNATNARLAWSILRRTNANCLITDIRVLDTCAILVSRGQRDKARLWLLDWHCNTLMQREDDGPDGMTQGSAALVRRLTALPTDAKTTSFLAEILIELEKDVDCQRRMHPDHDANAFAETAD